MKCKILVKTAGNPYPHGNKIPTGKGDLVPCCWNHWKDGFCRKHHPETVRQTLLARRARLVAQIEAIDAQLKS